MLDIRPIPVLLADSPADIETYLRAHLADTENVPLPAPSPAKLMAHATASAPTKPLSPRQSITLQSVFATIKELEAGTKTPEGQALIRGFFDAAVARNVIDFWEDEYLAA